MSYKAGIIGGAGFAGIELVRILLQHPDFDLKVVTSDANAGSLVSDMYPSFKGRTDLAFSSNDDADFSGIDVAFLAVPHTVALKHAPGLMESGTSVIDLSADFRLKDPSVYEAYYSTPHTQTELLAKAAFGLPELFWEGLQTAAKERELGIPVLVGCAGCYPTATSLAAAPAIRAGIVAAEGPIVVDAISGVTGAGKKATERTHFCFANENLEAYGLVTHRHTPEIEQILGAQGRVVFTPHLAPLDRGLLSTVTMPLAPGCAIGSTEDLVSLYREFYDGSTFVEVLDAGRSPRTASVTGSNNAQIGVAYNGRTNSIIAIGAIDNLCKGAAGQAVQCANIVFGMPESCGLEALPLPV